MSVGQGKDQGQLMAEIEKQSNTISLYFNDRVSKTRMYVIR